MCEVSPGLISWIQVLKMLRHAASSINKETPPPKTPVSAHRDQLINQLAKTLYQSHMCNKSKIPFLLSIIHVRTLDLIYKTEALRLVTTFDVSYRMRVGGPKIINYLDQATKDDTTVLVSKFIDLLKENK